MGLFGLGETKLENLKLKDLRNERLNQEVMQDQLLARVQLDVLAVPKHRSADLWAFRVQQHGSSAALLGAHLPKAIQHLLVTGVIAVGEVETSDVAACVQEVCQLVLLPAGGSEGAEDLRLANSDDVVRNHFKRNLRGALA